ncbi:choice-of-anchor I family protein [Salinispirillum marinum]|uniref:Choice-of-anchor I family protein n=2 Tax=Saccharospirillaceae TaxID=255527 RepID=A0ABV8BJR4_9GAMM
MNKNRMNWSRNVLAVGVASAVLSGCAALTPSSSDDALSLSFVGRYSTGVFGESAAEITAYDAATQRAFVVNAQAGNLTVLDLSNPANPTLIDTLTVSQVAPNAVVNSVAAQDGWVAVAVESSPKTAAGYMALFDAATLTLQGYVRVGAQPDMVTFTPDGQYVLTANEGEPSDDYQVDPEGSISIVDISNPQNMTVRTAGFVAFNARRDELRAAGVRIFGPRATVAQDLEPEYITVSTDSRTAWVALQENNALAKVDIARGVVTDVLPLGFKDHGQAGNGLDVSDDDNGINIQVWPGVMGTYHPDAITSYQHNGRQYVVTANEGDARAWGEDNDAYWGPEEASDSAYGGNLSQGFVEEIRVKHLVHNSGFARRLGDDMPPHLMSLANGALLNPEVFGYCGATAGDAGGCREDDQLGRLNVTWTQGYRTDERGFPVLFNADGEQDPFGDRLMYDQLFAYGTRSVAIWSADGELVWDSGDMIEQYLASDECRLGEARNQPCAEFFNSNHDEGDAFESRSDNKGPEPEAVAVAELNDRMYAFLGLERMGGVMVFDITNPQAPAIVDYLNTRNLWAEDPEANLATVGDLGIEDIKVIPVNQSPTGETLLLTGHEVSGTVSVYRVNLTQ